MKMQNAETKVRDNSLTLQDAFCILYLFLLFPEGIRHFAVTAVTAAVTGFELQLLALDADGGAGGDRVGDEYVGADDTVPADDGPATKNGSTGINGHMVLNGRMPLPAPQALTAPGGKGTQCDTLVNLHMLANDGGFADDDSGISPAFCTITVSPIRMSLSAIKS